MHRLRSFSHIIRSQLTAVVNTAPLSNIDTSISLKYCVLYCSALRTVRPPPKIVNHAGLTTQIVPYLLVTVFERPHSRRRFGSSLPNWVATLGFGIPVQRNTGKVNKLVYVRTAKLLWRIRLSTNCNRSAAIDTQFVPGLWCRNLYKCTGCDFDLI